MDPVAFHIGRLAIRWYGICVAAGFLAGYSLMQYRARTLKLGADVAADVCLGAILGGIAGARLLYVIMNWSTEFSGNWLEIIRVDHGGLVFFGGFLGATGTIIVLALHRKWPLLDIGDLITPALPLGHAFGRVGCFLNGCCFGKPWGGHTCAVHYPSVTGEGSISSVLYVQRLLGVVGAEATRTVPVFPVQLLSTLLNLTLCGALLYAGTRPVWRRRLFPIYLVAYGAARFSSEFLRGDYLSRPAGLTPAQWLAIPIAAAGVVWLLLTRQQARASADDTGGSQ